MAYNFFSTPYHAQFKSPLPIETGPLKEESTERLRSFDKSAWTIDPVVTILNGRPLEGPSDVQVDTTDAFNRKNGLMRQGGPDVVDKVLEHLREFTPRARDLRGQIRAIEEDMLGAHSKNTAALVANQAMDFFKQDPFTEIEEAGQAWVVERSLNDALLADEVAGVLEISRAPAFVGAVSNFSNFLDLCRKMFRNLEVGVPVILLSRNNTTQHMFRYFQILVERLSSRGVDAGMATYLACTTDEQRRVLSANPASPMYFTGSRNIAELIFEVMPGLVASTGGPNTMVVDELNEPCSEAARWSHAIEHKGQCTALRHIVVPNCTPDVVKKIYPTSLRSSLIVVDPIGNLGSPFGFFQDVPLKKPLVDGYKPVEGFEDHIAFRFGSKLPEEIDEKWREGYIDITSPKTLDDNFLCSLAEWCNREQPISLAINCHGKLLAKRLFELTSLVVYNIGDCDTKVALTCQARPQDGECFGEVPPRRMLNRVTRFPVIVPTSSPGYNSAYKVTFLEAQGNSLPSEWCLPVELENTFNVVGRVRDTARRGYCRVILSYLADAAGPSNPRRTVGERTGLYGLQRPPLQNGLTCVRLEKPKGANLPHQDVLFDDVIPFVLPFLATNARAQLVVSLDPFLSFPAFPMLQQSGLKLVRESQESFKRTESTFWNVVTLPTDALKPSHYPLVGHFISKLMAFGHVKTTIANDNAFIEMFKSSEKWLRCPPVADSKL